MERFLSDKIFWSYDYEVSQRSSINDIASLFSGFPPFHIHEGEIILTKNGLFITGDIELQIPLYELTQISLGFDDIFPRTLAKNGGLFWQPLRIVYREQTIYAIIDYNMFGTKNQLWFEALKELLSE